MSSDTFGQCINTCVGCHLESPDPHSGTPAGDYHTSVLAENIIREHNYSVTGPAVMGDTGRALHHNEFETGAGPQLYDGESYHNNHCWVEARVINQWQLPYQPHKTSDESIQAPIYYILETAIQHPYIILRRDQDAKNDVWMSSTNLKCDGLLPVSLTLSDLLYFTQNVGNLDALIHFKTAEGLNLLHVLAKKNDWRGIEQVFKVIKHFPDVQKWRLISSKCNSGKTAAHYAAKTNKIYALTTLLLFAKERDKDLIDIHDNEKRYVMDYASDYAWLRNYIGTHYWHVMIKPHTVLIFYNLFLNMPGMELPEAVHVKNHLVRAFRSQGIRPQEFEGFDKDLIKSTIKDTVREETPISALMVVILSHGCEGLISDKNAHPILVEDLIAAVCVEELRHIPKVK